MQVEIVTPSSRFEDVFLASVARSRSLHRPFASPPESGAEFQQYLRRLAGDDRFGFFIVRQGCSELVGVINVTEVVRGCFDSAYLGYYAFVPWAGQGLMSEGMSLVLSEAFFRIGLHRLEANIQPENETSIRLVKRLGFRKEGFSPRYLKIDGRWRDHERWAILREEWKSCRRLPAATRSSSTSERR